MASPPCLHPERRLAMVVLTTNRACSRQAFRIPCKNRFWAPMAQPNFRPDLSYVQTTTLRAVNRLKSTTIGRRLCKVVEAYKPQGLFERVVERP